MSHARSFPPRTLLRSVWLWPALAMLSAGLFHITTPELWRDEVSSWSAATRSLGDLLGMLGNVDASNGAYYLMLHGWTELLGDSVLSLRLPSVLAMAGAAAFTALTARQLFDSRLAGLGAGLLLVAVPTVSRFAQEARSYAVVTCAVAAAYWLLLRALERPGPARWSWYALAMAVAGSFHLVALSSLTGQLVVVLAHWWRQRRQPDGGRILRQFPLAVLVALIPAVPVALLGERQSGRQLSWLPEPTFETLRFFWQGLFDSHQVLYAFLLLALPALLRPRSAWAATQALLLAAVPVLMVWLVSQGSTSYFFERYLLFTVPAWAVLAGGGIAAVADLLGRLTPRPVAATAALALIAVPLLLGEPRQRHLRGIYAHDTRDYAGGAAVVAAGYRPGDGIVAVAGVEAWAMVGPGVAFYLPGGVRPYPMLIERTAARADDLYPVECPVAARCIGDAPRTWLVTIDKGGDPYEGLTVDQRRALQDAFAPRRTQHLPGLLVTLLVRKA